MLQYIKKTLHLRYIHSQQRITETLTDTLIKAQHTATSGSRVNSQDPEDFSRFRSPVEGGVVGCGGF